MCARDLVDNHSVAYDSAFLLIAHDRAGGRSVIGWLLRGTGFIAGEGPGHGFHCRRRYKNAPEYNNNYVQCKYAMGNFLAAPGFIAGQGVNAPSV